MTGMRSEKYLRRSGVEMDGWVRNDYVQGREIMESILQNYGQEQTQNEFPSATVRKGHKRLTMKQEKSQVEKTHPARLLPSPPSHHQRQHNIARNPFCFGAAPCCCSISDTIISARAIGLLGKFPVAAACEYDIVLGSCPLPPYGGNASDALFGRPFTVVLPFTPGDGKPEPLPFIALEPSVRSCPGIGGSGEFEPVKFGPR